MTLHLRNTLGRRVEPVEPLEPGRVRMYTCGPTVYRYAHVGNLRSNLLADLIRRALLYHGIDVFQVKNITDVGHLRDEGFDRGADPMLVAAGLEHKTPGEIADAYEAAFHADEALVNILPAHVFPRATEHIPEMLALAEALEDAGYAYATAEGNVYYDVGRFDGYGQLSGNTLTDLRAGHRGDIEPDKRDPADFALWKAAGDGRILKWPTDRWGEGFPGWHLECSAMAMRYLGPRFDIHTGGIDNVFPHHEDEIAQSTPISGEIPARHWVHGEFLLMGGKKMAKSAGNFQRVTELVDRGLDPLAFRYLVLTSRYSRKLEYSDRSIAAAAAALESLRAGLRSLGPPPPDGPWAAPPALRAGAAGDRPVGVAEGVAGHGGDGGGFAISRPGRRPAAPLSTEGRAFHRAVRGGHRRRPRHAGRPGVAARDPASPDRRRRTALAHPRCRSRPRARPRSRLGGRDADGRAGRRGPGRGRGPARGSRRRPGRPRLRAADALRDELDGARLGRDRQAVRAADLTRHGRHADRLASGGCDRPSIPTFLTDLDREPGAVQTLVVACLALIAAGLHRGSSRRASHRSSRPSARRPEIEALLMLASIVAAGGLLLVGGVLGDADGRKRVMMLALGALSSSPVIGGSSSPMARLFMIGRFVDVASASIVLPIALAGVADPLRGRPAGDRHRHRLRAYGAATAAAPVLLDAVRPDGPTCAGLRGRGRREPSSPSSTAGGTGTTCRSPDPGTVAEIWATAIWAFGIVLSPRDHRVPGEERGCRPIARRRRGGSSSRAGWSSSGAGAARARSSLTGRASPGRDRPVRRVRHRLRPDRCRSSRSRSTSSSSSATGRSCRSIATIPFMVALVVAGPVAGILLGSLPPADLIVVGDPRRRPGQHRHRRHPLGRAPATSGFAIAFVLIGAGFVIATTVRTAIIFASVPRGLPATAAALNEVSVSMGSRAALVCHHGPRHGAALERYADSLAGRPPAEVDAAVDAFRTFLAAIGTPGSGVLVGR